MLFVLFMIISSSETWAIDSCISYNSFVSLFVTNNIFVSQTDNHNVDLTTQPLSVSVEPVCQEEPFLCKSSGFVSCFIISLFIVDLNIHINISSSIQCGQIFIQIPPVKPVLV